MDELSSSLGPYEIGMGVSSAHLLLSAITLRVEEGAVAGAALLPSPCGRNRHRGDTDRSR